MNAPQKMKLPLFSEIEPGPPGFRYRDSFISPNDEDELLASIAGIEFSTFTLRDVVAKRRVAFFGESSYAGRSDPAPPIPDFLIPLRARLAAWAEVEAAAFAMVLINEYVAGAPIGWHRDAPQYDLVAGVSLGSACRMKLRPYRSLKSLQAAGERTTRKTTHELRLAPRSAYLMSGLARSGFEHSIPPVETLRYSITFRTLRKRLGP